jgi:hypothetical protein
MITLLLKINNLVAGSGQYPVELHSDDPTADGAFRLQAAGSIPANFAVPGPEGSFQGAPLDLRTVLRLMTEDPNEREVFRAVGRYLFELIQGVPLRSEWQRLRQQHQREDAAAKVHGLRTVLEVAPRDLRPLPWELLHDGVDWLYRSNVHHTVVRGAAGQAPRDHPACPRWRVLVVTGIPADDAKHAVADELEQLQQVFWQAHHCLDLRVLVQPLEATFLRELKEFDPDVFHFIGHGDWRGDDPALVFQRPTQAEGWRWERGRVQPYVSEELTRLRLVYLSACGGNATTRASPLTLTDDFLAGRVRAVVGMFGKVRSAAAARCAAAFYQALVRDRLGLDRALAAGRAAMNSFPVQGFPQLTVCCPVHTVLPRKPPDADAEAQFKECVPFWDDIRKFVDRPERHALQQALRQVAEPGSRLRVIVLSGKRDGGKSRLVVRCLDDCTRRFFRVFRARLCEPTEQELRQKVNPTRSVDFVAALRRMRESMRRTLIPDEPHVSASFAAFDNCLNQRPRTSPAAVPAGVQDDRQPSPGLSAADQAEPICTAFLEAAATAANARPVLLILDQITPRGNPGGEGVNVDDFNQYLFKHLVKPVADGKYPNLCLLLVVTTEEYEVLHLNQLPPSPRTVHVQLRPIMPDEYPVYIREHMRRRNYKQKDEPLIVDLVSNHLDDWEPPPGLFRQISALYKETLL